MSSESMNGLPKTSIRQDTGIALTLYDAIIRRANENARRKTSVSIMFHPEKKYETPAYVCDYTLWNTDMYYNKNVRRIVKKMLRDGFKVDGFFGYNKRRTHAEGYIIVLNWDKTPKTVIKSCTIS